jgi:hypothetical protein
MVFLNRKNAYSLLPLKFYHTLTKFLPGSWRASPRSSSSNSAAITSDEVNVSEDASN